MRSWNWYAPSCYVDWHDSREFSIGDIGVGECAGEVVTLTQFGLASAESKVFDSSLMLDGRGDDAARTAPQLAYRAMIVAAQALLKMRDPDIKPDPEVVFGEFKSQFIDTQLFFERYVGASEWQYFQSAHDAGGVARDLDEARRRVAEAQLFVEASHACYLRLLQSRGSQPSSTAALPASTTATAP